MENAHAISATLDLTNDTQRTVCDLIRRFHSGRWPVFRRMHDIRLIGNEIVELAEWRSGGFAVVHWSLTEIALRWQDYECLRAARSALLDAAR
jgi:hypothetical protein